MNYKKLSILLLVALLAINTYAQDEPETDVNQDDQNDQEWTDDQDEDYDKKDWECKHEHHEREEPELVEIDEDDYNPEGNDHSGRTLASYNNMRTYGYYGGMNGASTSFRSYVQNRLIPPILDYFSAALRVKYPVSGLLRVSTGSICGVATPSILRSGVAADYVYIVTVNSNTGYVASSGACSQAAGSRRPIVGHTVISQHYMSATTNVLLHERNMICIMHEVIHTLGWTNGAWSSWLDYQTGRKISNPTTTVNLDGATTIVLQAEPIRSMVREYFGCPSLKGAYMENTGSAGTYGCHFERRQFAYEAMTSGLIYQMQFSKFSLGLLESTGWFVPDYSYADSFSYGQGEGCNFLTETCSRANTQFADLCASTSRGCTSVGRGGGMCGTDSRSDSCRFQQPMLQYDCENPGASSYARLPQIQSFGRGTNAKCFTGSLSSGSAGSKTSFCFKHTCSGSGSGTELTLHLGGKSVLCTSRGPKVVSGYAGTIDCPDPVEFCKTVGSGTCPRGCMGRGSCVNGVCICNKGSGTDCAAP